MLKKRDTYKYHFKVGKKIVHGGITNDLDRREHEHQQTRPKGHIVQVGRRTTKDAARQWEIEMTRESRDKSPIISGSRQPSEYRKAIRSVLSSREIESRNIRSHKRSINKDH